MNLASGPPTPTADSRHSGDDTSFIPAFVVDRFVEEWESTGRPPDFDAYLPEITTIVGAIRALRLGGIAAFIGAYWLFRKLEEDLLTPERVTSNESEPIMAI